jgi:hypothetical protein
VASPCFSIGLSGHCAPLPQRRDARPDFHDDLVQDHDHNPKKTKNKKKSWRNVSAGLAPNLYFESLNCNLQGLTARSLAKPEFGAHIFVAETRLDQTHTHK